MKSGWIAIAFGFGAWSCASPPPPPAAPDSAIVAVHVEVSDLFGWTDTAAEHVYFVRVDGTGKLDQPQVIASNYTADDYAYLLDAAPGTYAAVACSYEQQTQSAGPVTPGLSFSINPVFTHTTMFPESTARRTIVTVAPGTLAFMGEFTLGMYASFDKADALQQHFHQIFDQGGMPQSSGLLSVGHCGEVGEQDQSAEALKRFLDDARERLEKAGWSQALQRPVLAQSP